ncbi:MAG TPA: DUF1080 domain-containing protein, partial [Verrucomicrobiota bacterium]|nr:DUF1080 domain-containing protein [Verrucomicrobiota bacterium]
SPSSPSSVAKANWVSLFDGRDLAGWSGGTRYWSVVDGSIDASLDASQGHPERSYLVWTNVSSPDFELQLQFRFVSAVRGGHGTLGVGIRGSDRRVDTVPDAGYIFKVSGVSSGRGSICREGEQYPPLVWRGQQRRIKPGERRDAARISRDALTADPFRADGWNELVLVAQGEQVIVQVNGVTTAELWDEDVRNRPTGSFITLIARRGEVGEDVHLQFKDIRLKTLSAP